MFAFLQSVISLYFRCRVYEFQNIVQYCGQTIVSHSLLLCTLHYISCRLCSLFSLSLSVSLSWVTLIQDTSVTCSQFFSYLWVHVWQQHHLALNVSGHFGRCSQQFNNTITWSQASVPLHQSITLFRFFSLTSCRSGLMQKQSSPCLVHLKLGLIHME